MQDDLKGQVTRSAAEIYEEFFVPALFLEPARLVARAAEIKPAKWCWMSPAEHAFSHDRLPK